MKRDPRLPRLLEIAETVKLARLARLAEAVAQRDRTVALIQAVGQPSVPESDLPLMKAQLAHQRWAELRKKRLEGEKLRLEAVIEQERKVASTALGRYLAIRRMAGGK